ncbi:MAG: AAA family ATPase [Anaerolineae bacterium]
MSLTLCAPTGKAARRMTEATGLPAATIHRTLGIFDDEEARYSFQTDAVTIDESSMITAALMRRIVKACGERTRLIFVGDVDQLPPVGAGEPFFQLIQLAVWCLSRASQSSTARARTAASSWRPTASTAAWCLICRATTTSRSSMWPATPSTARQGLAAGRRPDRAAA